MNKSLQSVVSVIIVSWNVSDSLRHCLQSLISTKYPHLEIIVIDNNSSDDSVKIASTFPKVEIIANPENIGFPRAVNQGLRKAAGDYVLLLNPDTEVSKDFFETAVVYAQQNPNLGILGPKFVNPDGSAQGSVFPEPSIIAALSQYWFGRKNASEKYTPKSAVPCLVNAVSGGAMFIPRQTLYKVGFFTEAVFMYYEDLDYCRRVRRAGLEIIFHPGLKIIHEHGQSSKKSGKSYGYLVEASKWYNGWLKHTLLTAIIWSGQKKQQLFGAVPPSTT